MRSFKEEKEDWKLILKQKQQENLILQETMHKGPVSEIG